MSAPFAATHVAGALLVEVLIAILLYGIATTQAYIYWWNYPSDTSISRWTVLVVWLLETLHTILCLDVLYNYTIVDFGNIARIELIFWSYGASVIVGILIAVIVQSFFIRRIWILSRRNKFMTIVPTLLLVPRIAFGLVTASFTFTLGSWSKFRSETTPLITLVIGLSLAAIVDLIIAATLILNLQKSRTGSYRTDHIIQSLQVYVVNTGAITVFVSLAIILTFALMKGSLAFAGLVEIQSKLYANSFLATLNARQHWTTRRGQVVNEVISMQLSTGPTTAPAQAGQTRPIEIVTTVTKITDKVLYPRREPAGRPVTASKDTLDSAGVKVANALA